MILIVPSSIDLSFTDAQYSPVQGMGQDDTSTSDLFQSLPPEPPLLPNVPLISPTVGGSTFNIPDANTTDVTAQDQAFADQLLSGGSSGPSAAQIAQIIAAGAQAGTAIAKSTQAPYLIPGTNTLYNPATGQILSSLGFSSQSLSSILPILLLAGGALLVFSVIGKK